MSYATLLKKSLLALSIATITGSIIISCSSSDTAATATTENYNGPGSKWDLSLNSDGSFDVDHRPDIDSAIDYTFTGTYVRESTGFVNLSITGGTGVDAPAPGSTAWGIEVPGYAMMLKPVGSDQLVAMVKSGDCPTADFDANWVIVKQDVSSGNANAASSTSEFSGQFSYDFATSTPSLPVKKSLAGNFATIQGGGIDPGLITCESGILNIPSAIMYLTSNGGAIVHTDGGTANDSTDDTFIFALAQKTLTNINEIDGQYAGMLFDENGSVGSKLQPVSLSCTSGSCNGNTVTDVTTGATSADGVTITLSGSLNDVGGTNMNGFVTGTIDDGQGGTGTLMCMIDPDALSSGKKIVSCVGQSPGDTNTMFNVLFVSI